MGSGEENKQKATDINLGKTQSLKAFNTLFTASCSDLSTCSWGAGGSSGTHHHGWPSPCCTVVTSDGSAHFTPPTHTHP